MKSNKAITLIALIVTIIVLLILAGVTVTTLTGENGLLNRAKIAAEENKKQEALEELKIKIMEVQTEKQGNATLVDFVEYLKNDTNAEYEISTSKSATITGTIPENIETLDEIYITYKNIEFKVDKKLNVEIVESNKTSSSGSNQKEGDDSTETGSETGDGTSGGNVQLGECSRYIKVDISGARMEKMTLSVDIPSSDNIKTIHYFVDDEEVYSGIEKSYTVTGLENNKEYEAYAIVEYNNEKVTSKSLIRALPNADIYVSTTGNDTTGNGSDGKPYATVAKAISVATSGQKIYVMAGQYTLTSIARTDNAQLVAGICDKNKQIEIFGANEETILTYDGSTSTVRDGNAIIFQNSKSIIRNLTYIYKPKNSGNTYSRAIFGYTSTGTIKNIFFRISGSYKATYLYGSTTALSITNCTFFHDLGSVDSNYSGTATYKNIATNVNTNPAGTNVITKAFGNSTDDLQTLIQKSKNNSNFNTAQAGVFYGDNAWD